MEIKLKSNRTFLIKMIIVFIALLTLTIVGMLVCCIANKSSSGLLIAIILLSLFDCVYIIALIVACKKRKPEYTFNTSEIKYTKKNTEYTINVENIKSMTYYKTKWYDWFLLIFVILLGDGGGFIMPVIDIKEKDGKEHQLGYFDKKQVNEIQQIYGSLLTIK